MGKHIFIVIYLLAAILAGCAKAPAPQPAPQPSYIETSSLPQGVITRPYVAPQSAPVLPPSYPSLGGAVVQTGTGSIPLVQGR